MSASLGDRSDRSGAPVSALRRFAQKRSPERAPAQVEHCELCSEVIPSEHRHLLELSSRALICACQACALLFSEEGSGAGKYKLVSRRYLSLLDFQMADQQWDELMIPVNMAFIFRSSGSKHVMAFYPSPAGATESLLDLEGWETLTSSNPILHGLEPDVRGASHQPCEECARALHCSYRCLLPACGPDSPLLERTERRNGDLGSDWRLF